MALLNVNEASPKPDWYNVNLPEPYNRIAVYNDDLYIRIEGVGLSTVDVIAWLADTETGTVLVRDDGAVFISGNTTLAMLNASLLELTEEAQSERKTEIASFEKVLSKIYNQLLELEKTDGK